VALISPSLIDWNDYRDEIADQIRKATGRDFVIDGDVDFQLLPAPTLSVGVSRLANLEGAVAPDMVRLKSFDMRIQFLPLFSRRIVIESMVLREPVVELEVLADGRRNWEFGQGTAKAGRASTEGAPGAAVMGAVRLDSLTIDNATLIFRDRPSGRVERIEGLNAEIAAQSLYGPLRVKGGFSFKGIPLGFEVDAGKIAAGESTPVSLRLKFPAAKAETRISGTLSVKDRGPQVTAKLRSQGPDLGRFAALLMSAGGPTPELPGFLARPFTLESALAYSAKGIEINDIAIQLDETRASGALNVQLGKVPRIDAALSFNRIDLDQWLASGMVSYGAGRAAGDGTLPSGGTKAPDAGTPLAVSLPTGVRASIDISVEAMAYRGGVIRQAKLNASLAKGKLTLHQASVFLPGGSDLSLTGVLTAKRDKPRFTGTIEAVSDNFRGLLSWLKVDAASLPAGRLHKLSLAAKLGATEERLEVRDLDLRFDSSRVTGGIIFALRSRLAFGANIAIDRLNLDAYLPAPAGARRPDGKPAGAGGGAVKEKGAPGSAVLAVIEDFDANLKAHIGELTYNHVPLKDIRFDGTLLAGKVKVRGASIGKVAGGRVALSGSLGGIAKAPEVNLVFDVTASDPARWSQLTGIDLPVSPKQLGLVAFSGRVEGTLKRLNLDATLKADKATLAVKGSIGDLDTAPRYAIDVNARHPSFTRLVRIFDPGFKPAARELGGFRLKAAIKNDGPVYKFSDITGKLGPVKLAGNAVLRVGGARPKLTAELAMSEIIADMFLPVPAPVKSPAAKASPIPGGSAPGDGAPGAAAEHWSREPIDFSPLKLIDADVRLETPALNYREFRAENTRMDVKLVNGVLDIKRLDGTVFGGALALKGRISAAEKANAPGQANALIEITRVDVLKALGDLAGIDAVEGRANLTMSLSSAGRSGFDLVSALAGKGKIDVADGAVKGIDLGRINEKLKLLNLPINLLSLLQTATSGGKTRFTAIDGTFTIAKGVVTTRDMRMIAEGGEGRAAGTADLPKWLIDLAAEIRLADHPRAPPFEMQLKGPLDSPRRIFKADKLQAYLAQLGVGSLLERFLPRRKSGTGSSPTAAPTAPAPAPAPRTQPAPQPAPPPSPEDFIRGILKGLGG
ncbi:MAG: AsmA family protein, partial [Alphaproteobacteria bacterium]